MDQQWQDFLTRQGAQNNNEHFGDLQAELQAARQQTIIAPLTDQGVIRVSGEDAASFLHNLLTNDITHLSIKQVRRAAFCTAKGRVLASFLIWRQDKDYLLQLSADILPEILKKLSMYILRSKVKLSDDRSSTCLFAIAGADAASLLGSASVPMSIQSVAAGTAICLDKNMFLLATNVAAAKDTWEKLKNSQAAPKPVGLAAWRLVEITAGLPRIIGATQDVFVPQMLNFENEALNGVSFQKGCYPGQEIVARVQYLGKIKRRMYRARLDESLPAGTDLYASESGDQHCGTIVLGAPAPASDGGGYEYLVVAASSAVAADAVHAGSLEGPKLEFLPLPYSNPD